ncbi:uncharacterized protein LACBIDRAFT_308182 [Laccaria bicolor S238N-H82]|uniref:Predicted protein n=1 Tax=Laccaria bicolor (strain S238N-H82 / ATCC MYA-4686) TaxID=486041 RepID=B0DRS7_LACBS|nr:uncharacterized protein LACBIDRAFT_308182 [Laccaria bicolor S238N-H82]EDR02582.1 predicted protein [Laccaria bicolor S238N-H82]|eukprot:XP_001886626.1 predicted protein [Laccaria bicolor S238N-H82]
MILARTQECLKEKVEQPYASLNIQDSFPELEDIDLDFVKLLVLACDLKINIRKQAIGSFFEWDRLDQATGGHQHAIGTKIHQNTRNVIAIRKPARLRAILKFNNYCEQLEGKDSLEGDNTAVSRARSFRPNQRQRLSPTWNLQRSTSDPNVLHEQRAVASLTGRVSGSGSSQSDQTIQTLLKSCRDHLISLKSRWSNTLASSPRFDTHVQAALKIRHQDPTNVSVTSPSPDPLTMTWLQPLMQDVGELTFADPVYHTADLINLDDMQTDTGEILFGNMIDAEVDEDDEDEAPPLKIMNC